MSQYLDLEAYQACVMLLTDRFYAAERIATGILGDRIREPGAQGRHSVLLESAIYMLFETLDGGSVTGYHGRLTTAGDGWHSEGIP